MSARSTAGWTTRRALRHCARRRRKLFRRLRKQLRPGQAAERLRFTVAARAERRRRGTYATSLASVPSRLELPAVLNARGLLGVAVEVGVQRGRYSDTILRGWRGRTLISVDPWLAADETYDDGANVTQDEHDRRHDETLRRLGIHGARSEVWRCTSLEAADRIAAASVDFVYLDARHDYVSVRDDLSAWLPRVRPGGILAGHDYLDGQHGGTTFEVRRAVDGFFREVGITVYCTAGPSRTELHPSWLVEVPDAVEGRYR